MSLEPQLAIKDYQRWQFFYTQQKPPVTTFVTHDNPKHALLPKDRNYNHPSQANTVFGLRRLHTATQVKSFPRDVVRSTSSQCENNVYMFFGKVQFFLMRIFNFLCVPFTELVIYLDQLKMIAELGVRRTVVGSFRTGTVFLYYQCFRDIQISGLSMNENLCEMLMILSENSVKSCFS